MLNYEYNNVYGDLGWIWKSIHYFTNKKNTIYVYQINKIKYISSKGSQNTFNYTFIVVKGSQNSIRYISNKVMFITI